MLLTALLMHLKACILQQQKRGSVFIGFMTPAGAIYSKNQRTVIMRGLSYSAGDNKDAPKG